MDGATPTWYVREGKAQKKDYLRQRLPPHLYPQSDGGILDDPTRLSNIQVRGALTFGQGPGVRGGAEGVVDDLRGLALHGEFCNPGRRPAVRVCVWAQLGEILLR